MTTLLDGRVLVTGGAIAFAVPTNSVEVFNPATSSFSGTAPMHLPRYLHRASLLPSGKVLVTGGFTPNPFYPPPTPPCVNTTVCFYLVITNTSEIYDPATNSWTMGPSMSYNRATHDQILLPTGRVLVTGGVGKGSRFLCRCSLRTCWLLPRLDVHQEQRCGV